MSNRTDVVLHDAHWPKTNKPTINAIMHFLSDVPVDGVTWGGDQFDFEEIAHHNRGKALYQVPGSYQRNIESFDQRVLAPIEKLLKRGCLKRWHIGNHERFEFDFIEEHPELQGTIDHTRRLRLAERGWEVFPLGHCSTIGKLNVIHGEILTGIGNQAGMYPARKAVDLYGANVLAGHVHAPQSYTRISPVERTQKHMGWIAPCLCDLNPTYLRNRPTAWLNGFTVVESQDNGLFNVYPVIIAKGTFRFGGRTYGTKQLFK